MLPQKVIDPDDVHLYTRFLYPVTENGDESVHVGYVASPKAAGKNPFVEKSALNEPDKAGRSSDVPEIAVNGVVLGVKVVPLG